MAMALISRVLDNVIKKPSFTSSGNKIRLENKTNINLRRCSQTDVQTLILNLPVFSHFMSIVQGNLPGAGLIFILFLSILHKATNKKFGR